MKKMLKVINVIIIVIFIVYVLGKLFGNLLGKIPAVPNGYTSKVKTGGSIEAKYIGMGTHEVEYTENVTMSALKKFEIYYPKDISSMNKVPVVVFLNGTGIKGSKYPALQKHLASWGFITIANEEENSFYGEAAELSIRYLKFADSYQDDKNSNPIKGHINFDNIGITGHSQGGIGVINGITIHPDSNMFKAAVILSSTETDAAKALLWDSDSSLIKANTLIVGSTGDTDSKIAPIESLNATYEKINGVDKVLARRNDADHGQMLYYADGYVTAWFMYYLQNDESAKEAFASNGELSKNSLYQDFKSDIQ